MHITIGSYTRIAEQIPSSSNRIPSFQYGKSLFRTVLLQMDSLADTGNTSTDNDDVVVFHSDSSLKLVLFSQFAETNESSIFF